MYNEIGHGIFLQISMKLQNKKTKLPAPDVKSDTRIGFTIAGGDLNPIPTILCLLQSGIVFSNMGMKKLHNSHKKPRYKIYLGLVRKRRFELPRPVKGATTSK
jgi:hypothetical protein